MKVETPVRAMRTKCLECANWNMQEVASCPMTDCALWPYRKGKRPTEEDIAIVEATVDPFAEQKAKFKRALNFKPPASGADVAMDACGSDIAEDNSPA